MQYRAHSKHQIRQYCGYGVSIATNINVTQYPEINVVPPQCEEPTESHMLVAMGDDVTMNDGSTSHRSELYGECGSSSEKEKKSWWTTSKKMAAAVVAAGGKKFSWDLHGKGETDEDSEKKSWWTTPKKIAAVVVGGLLIGGAAVLTIVIATSGANGTEGNTDVSLPGSGSGSYPTFTTDVDGAEAVNPGTNGLDNEDLDNGISTYTPSINTEDSIWIGIPDIVNWLSSEPFKLPTERHVPRYTTQPTDRKYNRVQDRPFGECHRCVKSLKDFERTYNWKLESIESSKYQLYRQRLEYNKAFIEDINATLSILESGQEGDSAVDSVRTDLTTALQHQKEALMQEQPDLNDRLNQTSISDYHPIVSFQGDSDLYPKIKPGNFTSEEMHHLNRVAAARDRYEVQGNLLEVTLEKLGQFEYLASLQAQMSSMTLDVRVIDEDIRIWSDSLPLEDARSEKQAFQTELSNRREQYKAELRVFKELEKEVDQTILSLRDKYPEIVRMQ